MVCEMRIMDVNKGDIKHIWDSEKPEEVEIARDLFRSTRKRGYRAYRVDTKGKQTIEMKDFDPEAQAMILAPFVSGG